MSLLGNQVIIRLAKNDDLPYIFSTWTKGYCFGREKHGEIVPHAEITKHRRVIEYLIKNPDTVAIVACLANDPEVIVGYCVSERKGDGAILHWVFVRPAWRKLGIAKSLVYPGTTEVSHLTKIGKSLKPAHWKYSPLG